jgi:hypothetical protein
MAMDPHATTILKAMAEDKRQCTAKPVKDDRKPPSLAARFGPKLNQRQREKAASPLRQVQSTRAAARPFEAYRATVQGCAQDEICTEARTVTSKLSLCLAAHGLRVA